MIFRLLLLLFMMKTSSAFSQKNDFLSISTGLEISHFAQATPGHAAIDFHLGKKRSMFTVGYAFALFFTELDDEDDITPFRMKIPSLNISYTYKFVQPANQKFEIGITIAYRYGHWRTRDALNNQNYASGEFLDTTILQVTQVSTTEKRESDFHHFQFGVYGEYSLGKVRLNGYIGAGVVFQSSYHFDEEITYYNDGSSTKQFYYLDVSPFRYLSPSWTAKLGVMIPISIFRW